MITKQQSLKLIKLIGRYHSFDSIVSCRYAVGKEPTDKQLEAAGRAYAEMMKHISSLERPLGSKD